MQWFNWILRGGKKETLPEFFLESPWLRRLYPLEEHARRVVSALLAAGPLSEGQLRSLTGDQLDAYVQGLLRDQAAPMPREKVTARSTVHAVRQPACLGSEK